MTTAEILPRFEGVRPSGSGYVALCPAHDDHTPSLSISTGDRGDTLLHCHAGCATESVCAAAGLKLADLFANPSGNGSPRRQEIVATYPYEDAAGKLLSETVKLGPLKTFRQRRPARPDDPPERVKGGFVWDVRGVDRVPYRLPQLLAYSGRAICVVEGEKDVDALAGIGITATTCPGGAGNWRPEFSRFFEGKIAIIIPDNDEPGRQHARQVARSLHGIATKVKVIELPSLPPKGDASDWLASGGTAEELQRLAREAPEWDPEADEGEEEAAGTVETEEQESTTDPPSETVILNPSDPYPGAREFERRCYRHGDFRTLHEQAGVFYAFDGSAYQETEASSIRSHVWNWANRAQMYTKKGDGTELVPFRPTTSKVNNLLDAIRAVTHLKAEHSPPCWLEDEESDPPASEIVACKNGLLDVRDRELHPSTPRFFTRNALPFPYQARPPQPTRWTQFLHELWGDDEGRVDDESIDTLQQMFGYFLLGDTSQQKLFLLVGPKRSGKGTIARVLTALLGHGNVCAPTLAGISTNFGLWPLIGKRLAIISDARLGARADQAAIAERLLSISGEDTLTIDRKHLSPWTGRLSTRFLILTNELPRLQDTSGALASRFVVLTLSRSFYGQEDAELTSALLEELPGIFEWALDGLDALMDRGRFQQPSSSKDAIREIEDLGSPAAAFVRDRCIVEPGCSVEVDTLFQAWKRWCAEQGRDRPGTKQSFGRNLRSVIPNLGVSHPRDDQGGRDRLYEGVSLRSGCAL